jgi:bacteriocin resistance YdeI/OmpD-like protein/uncharacterized protein DUF1905
VTQEFETRLMAKGPGGAWTYLPIPFDVYQVFGSKARVSVKGTINGFPFRNSLMPEGDGTHSMMVSKELQAGANARSGDLVSVTVEPDTEERSVAVPEELETAFMEHPQAASVFDTMTFSQKKEYVDWISTAKQAATKASRVVKAVEMLAAGKKRLR